MDTPTPGIHRALMPFETDFFIAPNEWMRDPNLSFKAKGLLAYFLTHNAGYTIAFSQIVAQTADGKSAIRTAVEELVEQGYLVTNRTVNERGFNAGLAYILVNPSTSAKTSLSENPTLENPTLENRTAYKKNNSIKEEQEIKNSSSNDFEGRSVQDLFDEWYSHYPRKTGKQDAYRQFVKALKLVSFEKLLAGVIRFANDPNQHPKVLSSKIKHPATWLSKGCWDDEPLPVANYTREESMLIQVERNKRVRDTSREATQELLLEMEERKRKATPPPQCKHGKSAITCRECLFENR
jgi:hypothetical protein